MSLKTITVALLWRQRLTFTSGSCLQSFLLRGIMANASELDGDNYSGKLTNLAVDYILQGKAKIGDIQIQSEQKSKVTTTSRLRKRNTQTK